MKLSYRSVFAALSLASGVVIAIGCSEDTSTPGDSDDDAGSKDASSDSRSSSDGSSSQDSGAKDTGSPTDARSDADAATSSDADTESDADTSDANTEDAADAGPTVTETTGPSGALLIDSAAVTGAFYDPVTTLSTPDCAVHIYDSNAPYVSAGNFHITGGLIGQDGGVNPSPVEVVPEVGTNTYFFADGASFLYDITSTANFSFTNTGAVVAAMANPVVIKAPSDPILNVTSPMPPDGGAALLISPTAPFTVQWTPPTAGAAEQVLVDYVLAAAAIDGGAKFVDLYCAFPASAGTGTIPAALFAAMLQKTGASSVNGGFLTITPGQRKVVSQAGGTLVFRANRLDGSSFPTTAADISQ